MYTLTTGPVVLSFQALCSGGPVSTKGMLRYVLRAEQTLQMLLVLTSSHMSCMTLNHTSFAGDLALSKTGAVV